MAYNIGSKDCGKPPLVTAAGHDFPRKTRLYPVGSLPWIAQERYVRSGQAAGELFHFVAKKGLSAPRSFNHADAPDLVMPDRSTILRWCPTAAWLPIQTGAHDMSDPQGANLRVGSSIP